MENGIKGRRIWHCEFAASIFKGSVSQIFFFFEKNVFFNAYIKLEDNQIFKKKIF